MKGRNRGIRPYPRAPYVLFRKKSAPAVSTLSLNNVFIFNNLNGAPGRTRTPNLLIRSQTLYPIELRAQTSLAERADTTKR